MARARRQPSRVPHHRSLAPVQSHDARPTDTDARRAPTPTAGPRNAGRAPAHNAAAPFGAPSLAAAARERWLRCAARGCPWRTLLVESQCPCSPNRTRAPCRADGLPAHHTYVHGRPCAGDDRRQHPRRARATRSQAVHGSPEPGVRIGRGSRGASLATPLDFHAPGTMVACERCGTAAPLVPLAER